MWQGCYTERRDISCRVLWPLSAARVQTAQCWLSMYIAVVGVLERQWRRRFGA